MQKSDIVFPSLEMDHVGIKKHFWIPETKVVSSKTTTAPFGSLESEQKGKRVIERIPLKTSALCRVQISEHFLGAYSSQISTKPLGHPKQPKGQHKIRTEENGRQ